MRCFAAAQSCLARACSTRSTAATDAACAHNFSFLALARPPHALLTTLPTPPYATRWVHWLVPHSLCVFLRTNTHANTCAHAHKQRLARSVSASGRVPGASQVRALHSHPHAANNNTRAREHAQGVQDMVLGDDTDDDAPVLRRASVGMSNVRTAGFVCRPCVPASSQVHARCHPVFRRHKPPRGCVRCSTVHSSSVAASRSSMAWQRDAQ